MTLSDLSIRRPVFAWMLMSALMIFGAISFFRLGVSQLPDVTYPILTVNVNWAGAAPELIETELVDRIEEAVISVQGIEDIDSTIREGTAQIKLQFAFNRNIDAALQETNSKLRSIRLPEGVDPPTIFKQNQDDNPIMWLNVSSKERSFRDLTEYVDLNLRDRFQVIPGVGDVVLGGWTDRNLRVWIDNEKLKQYQLTVLDVRDTIASEHQEVASGYMDSAKSEVNVRTMGEAVTPAQLEDMLITRRGGQQIFKSTIRLRDVAHVEDGLADVRRITRYNGRSAIGLGVQKQRGYNEVEVGNAVKAFMAEQSKTLPPDIKMAIGYDGTKFTKDAIRETEFTLILSIVITGLVCWAFLGSWSSTFNVLMSIPTSALGTFIVLYFMGFTLNFFTLLGLSLAVGIVVDDSIMVLENIVRHFHSGKTSRQAALDGAREITFAAVVATVAVVAIFLPVLLVSGVVGIFLFQFGITISTAVMLSLLESITLTPMRCSQFLTAKEDHSRFSNWINAIFERFAGFYRHVLDVCLDRRWLVLGVSFGLFILSFGLVPLLRKEFSPSQDAGILIVRFQTPVGSSLQMTSDKIKLAEEFMLKQPYVDHFIANAGGFIGAEINTGMAFVSLTDRSKRDLTHIQVMDLLRKNFNEIPDLKAFVLDPTQGSFSPKRGTTIELSVRGPDYRVMKDKVAEITKRLEAAGLMTDIDTDFRDGAPEVRVIPDREKAAEYNVSMNTITGTLNAAIGGVRAGKYTNGERRYDVRLRLKPEQWRTQEDVEKLQVRTNYGELIPLSTVTKTEVAPTLLQINRQMRQRCINIYANTAPGKSQSDAISNAETVAKEILPEGYELKFTGSSKTAADSGRQFMFTLLLGFLVSYMIMGAQFNSFIHPFTVLVSLFFTFTGALLALFITGNSINLYSAIGIILLMGIAKKNSILLVEFFNKQRHEHDRNIRDAILEGGPIRLRPILMTSAATVAAAVPPALGIGPGAEVRVPLAIVVIGGVMVSTFFTLLVVPCLYSLLSRLERN